MDAITLALWTREMAPRLSGARILDGGSGAPWHFSVGVGTLRLSILLDRGHPTVFEDPKAPARLRGGLPGVFADILFGATIRSLGTAPGERMLDVQTDRGRFIVEFYPACPQLVWVDERDHVVAIHANGRKNTGRVALGSPYRLPPAPEGVRFAGADRRTVAELDPDGSADFDALVDRAAARLSPVVIRNANRFDARPFPPRGAHVETAADTMNEALRLAYTIHRRHRREEDAAARLRADVKQLIRRVNRNRDAIERDLDAAKAWPTWQKYGSALMASPHLVRRGMTEVTVPDVFDGDGATVHIPLDPKLNAMENAAGYLKRAKRAERAVPVVTARLRDIRVDADWLAAQGEDPTEWDTGTIETLETMLIRHRIRRAPSRGVSPAARAGPGGFHPRRYRSSDGWTILVGRSNAENDWLSLKYAKPDDIWLHAQGVTGAHVVIRRDGRKDNPSARTLEEAAGLAAAFSRARHASTVPVIHTLAKYVRKPRKAPPGAVTCTREKTILVAPIDPKVLSHADDDRHD